MTVCLLVLWAVVGYLPRLDATKWVSKLLWTSNLTELAKSELQVRPSPKQPQARIRTPAQGQG